MTKEEKEKAIESEEEYYKPCSTCHNDECVWKGTKDTHLICEDYRSPDGDCISRQAVLEMAYDMSAIDGEHFTERYLVVDAEDIQQLPPVTPQPKTDVLDKIRAEIEARLCDVVSDYTDGYRTAIQGALAILYKYKAESEDKE